MKRVLLAAAYIFLSVTACSAAVNSRTDILVFSPHPDDETIACGGVIAKAASEGKRVRVVFLTRGEASTETCVLWSGKAGSDLTPGDRAAFGRERMSEARQAAKQLGLTGNDLVFLDFPDGKLLSLFPRRTAAGFSGSDLGSRIRKIIRESDPALIFLPHPGDISPDHRACAAFVLDAVNACAAGGFTDRLRYYIVHSSCGPHCFPPVPGYGLVQEPLPPAIQGAKRNAVDSYTTQLRLSREKVILQGSLKDSESFYRNETDTFFCEQYAGMWRETGRCLKRDGYQVNMAPVVDVGDVRGRSNHLMDKGRLFSRDADTVAQLSEAAVRGMCEEGIIPVVKHFPGLGGVRSDTHLGMEEVRLSRGSLVRRDLTPFKGIIDKKYRCWIMTGHAVYPALDQEPASLSAAIQRDLLRKRLGFDGVIISDELLCMQAMREYAFRQGLGDDWIGEIVVRTFIAGTDIALLYVSSPEDAATRVESVLTAVQAAVNAGRLSEKDIDDSLRRILSDKEFIFSASFVSRIPAMSLREKICQKLAVDVYPGHGAAWVEFLSRYPLGAVHARSKLSTVLSKKTAIPALMLTLYEGGTPSDKDLGKLTVPAAQDTGKEFARLKRARHSVAREEYITGLPADAEGPSPRLSREQIVAALDGSLEEVIGILGKLDAGRVVMNPSLISPIEIKDGIIRPRPFREVPFDWMLRFPSRKDRLTAYRLLATALRRACVIGAGRCQTGKLSLQVEEARFSILSGKYRLPAGRVLCFAAHPDDEDGDALAYLRARLGCDTYILVATRGEGGKYRGHQDKKGLADVRMGELRSAASILGVKGVTCLGLADSGFTLSAEDTLRQWGEEETVKKLVHVIRTVRPQIIITKHDPANLEEHGHHRALCLLMEKAVSAAGDPAFSCADGCRPWTVRGFYERITGKASRGLFGMVDAGMYLRPVHGTAGQKALRALKRHVSQSDWNWVPEQKKVIFYRPVHSSASRWSACFFQDILSDAHQ